MTPTKKTIAIWPDNLSRMLPSIVEQRTPYIESKVAAGVTDGVAFNGSNTVTVRTWLDQASAEDWVNFIVSLAADNGYTITVTIEDIPV
jgi:hypothetical protein